jgi:hypothetical protein
VFDLLRQYAWLIGDVSLVIWVIYELISLGPRKPKSGGDSDDPQP